MERGAHGWGSARVLAPHEQHWCCWTRWGMRFSPPKSSTHRLRHAMYQLSHHIPAWAMFPTLVLNGFFCARSP